MARYDIDNSAFISASRMTKKGRRIVGFFGLAFGSLFLIVGLGGMGTAIKRGLKQKATADWPSVQGKIVSTQLKRTHDKGADSPVLYEFGLHGGVYRSTRVAFIDRAHIDYHDWIQLANGLPRKGTVTVYYNPDAPNESVLVAGDATPSWDGLGGGAMFAGFAAFWMTAWCGDVKLAASQAVKGDVEIERKRIGESGLWMSAGA